MWLGQIRSLPLSSLCYTFSMAKKRTKHRTAGSKSAEFSLPADYGKWLTSLKQRIQSAREQALLAANDEQIRLYHDIGREILDRQSRQGWGAKVIDRLSPDLRTAFPDMKGLSTSNLKYMRFFALECPDRQIGQQSADQLPWFHIVTKNQILTGLNKPNEFILAVAIIDHDSTEVRYCRTPFEKEPDFKATSVNYDLIKLLAQARSRHEQTTQEDIEDQCRQASRPAASQGGLRRGRST